MKKNLLMLCYRAPYPIRSGSEIRMYQFLEILSLQFSVTLLYLKEREETGDMRPLYEKCAGVESFPVSVWKRCAQAGAGYLFRNLPLQAGYFYSGAMQRWVKAHIGEFSHILCMHIRTVRYVLGIKPGKLAGKHIFLDGIDAITLNYYNSYLTSHGLRRLVNGMEYRRMAEYERRAYSRVKKSILISERDRDYIVNELGADADPAVICNYAIDYGYQPQTVKRECTICFMGKMNYAPNVDAVRHFVSAVWPGLKKEYPQLVFTIIGGNATAEILKLGQTEGIELCGFVENPAVLLQEATLVIAPMVSGSGLQNKIVQAMYLGCTVVTTPVGADGLTGVTGEELIVAEAGEEFCGKLIRYLAPEAEEERRKTGERAREYIREHYSYEKIQNDILTFFAE